ncbi:MAG: hypothetical protein QOD84_899 [Acidobacteriaceae bacterium]|jgi:hypothetical protein
MILFVALLAIAAAAIAPAIVFQAKRDREEELIHRGVQYSRAMRAYYKKLGRYPTRIEDLESTSNLRFLRKRYKDPVTGQDFKLLRQQDVQLAFSTGAAGLAGAAALGQGLNSAAQKVNGQAALLAAASQMQGGSPAAAQPGVNVNADTQLEPGDTGDGQANAQQNSGQTGGAQAPGSNSGGPNPGSSNQPAGFGSGNATYGGGAIVGVASTSKLASIRSFNKKDHYNQWQFIYDPTTDRGGLVMTPNQPPLQNAVAPAGQQQQPGIPTPIEGASKPQSPGLQAQPPDQNNQQSQ